MKNLKVSVIIPAYNAEKYIERCLESLTCQMFNDIEVIIVDDGSTDKTGIIADAYAKKDKRIKVIHKENGGVTSARLTGVRIATGEYIGFVDADDYVEPTMYKKLVDNAISHNADISHCGYVMVFPSGRKRYYYNTGCLVVQDNYKGIKDLIEGKIVEPSLLNKLFKKGLFESLLNSNLMDLSIKINEDVLMNYYLFKASNKSVFEDVCLYHYMVREGSVANSKINRNKMSDPIKVTKIILEDITKTDCKKLINLAQERLLNQLIYYITLEKNENKDLISPFQKKFYKELKSMGYSVVKDKNKNKKLTLKVLVTIISPKLYKEIHKVYKKIRGIDNIYDLDK